MKKMILLLALILAANTYAIDCDNVQSANEAEQCMMQGSL